jgi:hypothetical protein
MKKDVKKKSFDRGNAAMGCPMTEIMQNGTISGFPDPAARLFARVEFRAPF